MGQLMQFLVGVSTVTYAVLKLQAGLNSVYSFVLGNLSSSLELRSDDEMYNYFIDWVTRRPDHVWTLSFVASLDPRMWNTTNAHRGMPGDGRLNDTEEDLALAAQDFEAYWDRRLQRDKADPLHFTPSAGTHWLTYGGVNLRWMPKAFSRFPNTSFTRYSLIGGGQGPNERIEILTLTCLGRSNARLKQLLSKAQHEYIHRDEHKTKIFKASDNGRWHETARCVPRSIDTVVLDAAQKKVLIDDIKEYLHPLTKKWYRDRGIPYKRGYCLSGPPGTGKTSLCLALAGVFTLPVCIVSLTGTTENALANLFSNLPSRSIIVLEDIDAAGLTTQKRKKDIAPPNNVGEGTPGAPVDAETVQTLLENNNNNNEGPGISLSALLNAIDGVISVEGRILMMTTNHIENLDPALLRPGRVDMAIHFQNITTQTANTFFQSFYSTADILSTKSEAIKEYQARKISSCDYPESKQDLQWMAIVFSREIPSGEFSPAEVQGYLLAYKYRPDKAIAGVGEWVERMRWEKAVRRGESALQAGRIPSPTPTPNEAATPETRKSTRKVRARSKSVKPGVRRRAL